MASRQFSKVPRPNRADFPIQYQHQVRQVVTELSGDIAQGIQESLIGVLFTRRPGEEPIIDEAVVAALTRKMENRTGRAFGKYFPETVTDVIQGSSWSRSRLSRMFADDSVDYGSQKNELKQEYEQALKRYDSAYRLKWRSVKVRNWLAKKGYSGVRAYWQARRRGVNVILGKSKKKGKNRVSLLKGFTSALMEERYGFQTGGVAKYFEDNTLASIRMDWTTPEGRHSTERMAARRIQTRINESDKLRRATTGQQFAQAYGQFGDNGTPNVKFRGFIDARMSNDPSVQMMYKKYLRNRSGFPLFNNSLSESVLAASIIRSALSRDYQGGL